MTAICVTLKFSDTSEYLMSANVAVMFLINKIIRRASTLINTSSMHLGVGMEWVRWGFSQVPIQLAKF